MKRNWVVTASLMLVLVLIPFKSLEAPQWKVNVVDKSQKPVSGVRVRESYKNYPAESLGGEQDLITDEQGQVIFPARTLRAPILQRMFFITTSLSEGVHASFGPHAHVFALGKCEGDSVKDGFVEDWTGHPSQNSSTIVCGQN